MIDFTKNFFVYGLGSSGKSCVVFFRNYKYNFLAFDDNSSKLDNFLNDNEIIFKKNILNHLKDSDYIIVSPSINIKNHKYLKFFKNKIITDIDIIFSIASTNTTFIGITGTEGKSTVSTYLKSIINFNNKAILLGNIGNFILHKPNSKKLIQKFKFIIFELSSYQLDKIKYLKIDVGLITNIYPDHLSYHKNFYNYIISKCKIKKLIKNKGKILINSETKKTLINFNQYNNLTFKVFINKNIKFLSNDSFFIQNKSAVVALLKCLNISYNLNYFKNLQQLPFRNNLIFKTNYFSIFNDSKSTNLLNSIKTFNSITEKNKVLILGGLLKSFQINLPIIHNSIILIFGEDKNLFASKLRIKNSVIYKFLNLNELVIFLSFFISNNFQKNSILFSPGGESFDSYKNFIERGRHFNSLVKKHINE